MKIDIEHIDCINTLEDIWQQYARTLRQTNPGFPESLNFFVGHVRDAIDPSKKTEAICDDSFNETIIYLGRIADTARGFSTSLLPFLKPVTARDIEAESPKVIKNKQEMVRTAVSEFFDRPFASDLIGVNDIKDILFDMVERGTILLTTLPSNNDILKFLDNLTYNDDLVLTDYKITKWRLPRSSDPLHSLKPTFVEKNTSSPNRRHD